MEIKFELMSKEIWYNVEINNISYTLRYRHEENLGWTHTEIFDSEGGSISKNIYNKILSEFKRRYLCGS